jgi:hypothetical protein
MSGTTQEPFAGLVTAGVQIVKVINMIAATVGNPNGQLAGQAGSASEAPDIVWDSTNAQLWICIVTGSSATAKWVNFLQGSTGGDASPLVVTAASGETLPLAQWLTAAGLALILSSLPQATTPGAIPIVNHRSLPVGSLYMDHGLLCQVQP